jgi:hypothetical protein
LVAVVAFAAGHFLPKALLPPPAPVPAPAPARQQRREQWQQPAPLPIAHVATALAPLADAPSGGSSDGNGSSAASPWARGGLGGEWPLVAEGGLGDRVAAKMEARLSQMLAGTYTAACKAKVRAAFEEYVVKSVGEDWLPFEQARFPTQECNKKALKGGATVAAAEVRLVYLLLIHEQAFQTVRLIESLWEPQHHFVVHVDAKYASAETHAELTAALARRRAADPARGANVHLLGDEYRTSVSWGGFNVVQATLNGFHAALHDLHLDFHWLVTMSG